MIHIGANAKEFHLQTKNTSYILRVSEKGHLLNLYYGKKITHRDAFDSLLRLPKVPIGNATAYDEDNDSYSLDVLKLEISSLGKGDYRESSLDLTLDDGTWLLDPKYTHYTFTNDKTYLGELPYVRGQMTETLVIHLEDQQVGVGVDLYYTIFEDKDVIVRSLSLSNFGKRKMTIEKAMSLNLDLQGIEYDMISLEGKWIKERMVKRKPLITGISKIDSKKGVSGSYQNPFMTIAGRESTENSGPCYGFALVYSGDHQAIAEVTPHGLTRLQMGINPATFSSHLDPGEAFSSPECVMTFSDRGMSGISDQFHRLIKENVVEEKWQNHERPILINNWEATYFDFDEKRLLKLAREAKKLGIELFVLDDGWFGKRNDDRTSLGDWSVNLDKLPNGLSGLGKKIRSLGMAFGIWVEPEMVSVNSRLYERHPEWVIKSPHHIPSLGRNQLILDLSKAEVVDYLFDTLSEVFKESQVTYVKWDMNRNFSDVPSKELGHQYVLGLYKLLRLLTKAFPNILFESCSSGGNRFDLGMLFYMPQVWTSDNTDPIERLKIQHGTSYAYPLSTMGAHVSASPNHQTFRNTPIETRFNVAAFGILGYELDLTKVSSFDKKAIAAQITFYKRHRKLLQFGTFHRLKSPFEGNEAAWLVVSEDKKEAMLGIFQMMQEPSPCRDRYFLHGLDEEIMYDVSNRKQFANVRQFGDLINQQLPVKIREGGILHGILCENYLFELEEDQITAYGDELCYAGFEPKTQFLGTGYNDSVRMMGDYGSRLYYLKGKDDEKL